MTNQEQIEETQHNGTPAEASYASFWRRMGAVVIDMILIYIFGNILQVISTILSANPLSIIGVMLLLLYFLTYLLYFPILEGSRLQATVGKMILGIKVSDGTGAPVSFLRALGRHFAKISCFFIVPCAIMVGIVAIWHDGQEFANPSDMAFVVGILAVAMIAMLFAGILTIVFSQRKQCLHDLLARTIVVRK